MIGVGSSNKVCPHCGAKTRKRTSEQNSAIHPMIRDIARFLEAAGVPKKSEEWWRYYLMADCFGQEMVEGREGRTIIMPKFGGTSQLPKEEATTFLEWLRFRGDELGVTWSQQQEHKEG